MLSQEDLQAIQGMLSSMEGRIHTRLDGMDKRLDVLGRDVLDLKEGQEEIRDSLNCLLDWAEECSQAIEFPLPRVGGKKTN